MTTNLLLMPVGAGKTAYALDALLDTLHAQRFARAWVVLPNTRQEDAFRQRLVEHPDARRVYFNVHFFDFYHLYQQVLDLAGQPQRELDHTARRRLLRGLLARLKQEGQLRVYSDIAQTRGFVDNIGEFIYELKQNLIYPDALLEQARTPKDLDLARIYAAYQDTLRQHHLVDRDGEGWLALDELENNPAVAADVALLLVDGFDQFNPLQARLLALLSAQAGRAIITLPSVAGYDSTLGRRFAQAEQQLIDAHDEYGVPLNAHYIHPGYTHDRHPALNDLLAVGFLGEAPPRPSDGCLTLIEAPDPAQEIGAALRQVKRRLLAGSTPDDVLIAVRDWERYGDLLAQRARAYGLPVALHYGEPLANNPAVIALLNALELHRYDFRQRGVMDVLRSPYFVIPGLDSAQVDVLERLSRAQQVTGGRVMWLEAIQQAAADLPDDDEIERFTLDPAAAAPLAAALAAFFDMVTPPAEASLADYVRWLENLIGADNITDQDDDPPPPVRAAYTLDLLRCIRAADDPTLVSRDLTALRELKRILRSLLSAQFLSQVLDDDPRTGWDTFYRELKQAVEQASVERRQNRAGHVLVTTVENARGLPHAHVVIVGLSEGIFPAPISEDPLYLDSERAALSAAGIPLAARADRAADDGLFYELLGLARQTLTLSRPTIQDGTPWPASHLWRKVAAAFDDSAGLIRQQRLGLGRVVPAADAASITEAVLAAADGLNQPQPDAAASGLYNWLITAQAADWEHVRRGRQIELGRLSRAAHDPYSGRLRDPGLIAWVADELGPRRVWSASQFNDYGACGFRFFAKRLLKLEAIKDPETGTDVLQLGLINHDILERTYRRLAQSGVSIAPEHTDFAASILWEEAAEVLQAAPARYGFRASALWAQEQATLVRKLEAFVRADFAEDNLITKKFGDEPRQPYRQEVPFGTDGEDMVTLDIGGEHLRARGRIDRIDRLGDRLVVIDYKTGSTRIPLTEMQRGRNFQMMLYLLVAQAMTAADPMPDAPKEVAGGTFWHLNTRELSGALTVSEEKDVDALIMAQEHLGHYIRRGRAGDFAVHPNKADGSCAHYCDFSQMCRVGLTNRFKREA